MNKDYSKQSINEYINELGSSSASPGGGSAAALTATVGVSLLSMVAAINNKRDTAICNQRAFHRKRSRQILKMQKNLKATITEDAKVFTRFMKFSGKLNSSPQSVIKECVEVPLSICDECVDAIQACVYEKKFTSKWLISDLYEAAILLEASFRAANLNIEINLKSITNKKYVAKIRKHIRHLKSSMFKASKKILKDCHA